MNNDTGKISFFSAVLMSVNIMVGAGIFYAVGPMTGASHAMSFLGWPLIGLLLFPVIWGIAKAAELFPGEGGFYHYCSSGLGPTAGFLAHWGYLIGYISSATSLATVLRMGLAKNVGIEMIQNHPWIFNVSAVAFYTLIQLLPLSKISKIQSVATLIKVTPILAVVCLTAFYFNPSLSFQLSDLASLSSLVPTVLFGFWGFEACCSIGGYLKGGPKKVPAVILIGTFVTVSLYMLFHFGLLQIMGSDALAAQGAVGFPLFLGLSSSWAAILQSVLLSAILFCWANSILGMSLGNIANLHSLAKKGLILGDQQLVKVNANDRPTLVVLLHGAVMLFLLTFITDIEILFALTNLGVLIAFAFTLVSAFWTYYKQRNFVQVGVLTLAFGSCSLLSYYSWTKIPSLVYILPIIIWMGAGWIQLAFRRRISRLSLKGV